MIIDGPDNADPLRQPVTGLPGDSFLMETKPHFRADTDQSGDWWVWRRLSVNGWATHCRCGDREEAREMAAQLNRSSTDVA
ncbi:MAG: hypothetical protein KDB18_10470 [Salinibacterium sp.]|nr:hypothetical protein [Salinibacterium sp.]